MLWIITTAIVVIITATTASRFARGGGAGDFHVFHDAFRAVLAGEDVYDSGVGGYIYPPLFAAALAPLGRLPIETAGTIFTILNGALILLCLWLSSVEIARRFDAKIDRAAIPAFMILPLAIFGDKLRIELQGGQTDLLILLGLLLSLRWIDRRPILAGIALGLAGNLKYQTLVMLPYLVLRGRWKAAASTGASLVAVALSTSLIFGWERNLAYLRRALGGLGRMLGASPDADAAFVQPLAWIRSISLPSVFARIEAWAGWPAWTTPALTLIAAGLVLACVMLLYRRYGCALFRGRGRAFDADSPRGRALVALEWTGLIVAVLVFGPQTNARHMILMIPLGTLAAVFMFVPRAGVRKLPAWIGAVFLLLAFILPPGTGDNNTAVHAWRWIGGVSIATLTLLFAVLASGLKWAGAMGGNEIDTSAWCEQ